MKDGDITEQDGPGFAGGNADLAGMDFWERNWAVKGKHGRFNPKNYSNRRFHEFFGRHLAGRSGRKILEVGCAQSSWLPYFRLAYGLEIVGIDYSPTGCRMAREALADAGAPGTILERDLFGDNRDLEGTADVLFSYGFIEHFVDAADAIRRMARLMKPGGTILTVVPNFTGWMGGILRLVNPEVYGMHVLLSPDDVGRAHREAGFEAVECGYFGSVATEVVKYTVPTPLRYRILRKVLKKSTKACWFLFRASGWHPETRRLSPYIVYAGRLSAETSGHALPAPGGTRPFNGG